MGRQVRRGLSTRNALRPGEAAVQFLLQRWRMQEQRLRRLIARVKSGKLSRRRFIETMAGLGLAAPFASQLLFHSGIASAATRTEYKPAKRGGGGPLKLLMWQGPTL